MKSVIKGVDDTGCEQCPFMFVFRIIDAKNPRKLHFLPSDDTVLTNAEK